MREKARSDPERSEIGEKSRSNDAEMGENGGVEKEEVSEYEKQRLLRIRENRARVEVLGLRSLASSLLSSVEKQKGKGKVKREEDDEYEPSDGEQEEDRVSSSSEDEEEEDDDDDFSVRNYGSSGCRRPSSVRKGKKESSSTVMRNKKKSSAQKNTNEPQCIDDDEALRQAIALSLESSTKASDTVNAGSCNSLGTEEVDANPNKHKKGLQAQEYERRKKRRKMGTNRVQMTEDQVIVHFYNFDASGKGSITLKDLRRVATAHDFTWTDKEMDDMIRCFDSDGDGKLTLEDFGRIVYRCNMIGDPRLA